MKIVFFGTAQVGLPILKKLSKEHDIVAVVTSPDAPAGRKQILTPSPIAEFSASHIWQTFKPAKVKNNPEFLEELKNLHADIFIVVAYGKILPLELINLPQYKTLNVHFSLLPKYRGASPIQYALLNGEGITGTSIFILDEGMDTGEMLASQELTIAPDDNFLSLSEKLSAISADLLLETLKAYQLGAVTAEKQDDEQATYTKLIKKEDGIIDWNKTATEIYNQHRAFVHWPGISTSWQGQKLKIRDCEIYHGEVQTDLAPGTITSQFIACGNQTALMVRSLQLEGKNVISFDDFLRGYPQILNQQLPS